MSLSIKPLEIEEVDGHRATNRSLCGIALRARQDHNSNRPVAITLSFCAGDVTYQADADDLEAIHQWIGAALTELRAHEQREAA